MGEKTWHIFTQKCKVAERLPQDAERKTAGWIATLEVGMLEQD